MAVPNLHQVSLLNAQMRAVSINMGEPYNALPIQTTLAALVKHGGILTLLDPDLMTARMAAFTPPPPPPSPPASVDGECPEPSGPSGSEIADKLRAVAANFFYKLVDRKGYVIHSELMAYISEPGNGNGVTYDEGADASPDVPAAFTFVGQFVDHDLTFNGMNLTVDESGVTVEDDASPVIDLDSVYGPRKKAPHFSNVFNDDGTFKLNAIELPSGRIAYDLPRVTDKCSDNFGMATILDPRNDENQIILQIHILIERFHNKLIETKAIVRGESEDMADFINRVRTEVVATWQSVLLHDYMPRILESSTLQFVLSEIKKRATSTGSIVGEYGSLKHKPYRDLVTGKNVVRMPHEFAIGFRFGHSQLRPSYVLNEHCAVLLFKDARASDFVKIDGTDIKVSGKDDLRGSRPLLPEHVIDWSLFYPETLEAKNRSLRIDHKVTARVFNLPESAIPDDIKYIGNLPHRNLIRSTQIGIVSGEELAAFYEIAPLTHAEVLGEDSGRDAAKALFMMDHLPGAKGCFKTPLWFYILKEAEVKGCGARLGPVGSRLVAEVLAGAIYYGNVFPYDDTWTSTVLSTGSVTLRDIINYVG